MKKEKIISLLAGLSFILIIALLISACKKDEEKGDNNDPPAPVNPLVNTYIFISATFNEPITVIVNGDTNNYEVGDNAYQFVGGGLLGAAPCDNADNAALQLRADYTSWYVCQNESNESQQGTWEPKQDNTILTLNIFDPATFAVHITGIVLADNKLSGDITTLPMPVDTSFPVGEDLPNGDLNFQLANVSVVFGILD